MQKSRGILQEHQSYFKPGGNRQILIWDITFLARASVSGLSFERNAAWIEDLLFHLYNMWVFLIWIPVILEFYLKKFGTIPCQILLIIFRYLLMSLISCWEVIRKCWCRKWGKCLTSTLCSVQSYPLISDSVHELFLDEKALKELAVIEWAVKGKLFIPIFFP